MTVSSYDSTYDIAPASSEDSMFGTPVYARRVKRQDKSNKVFMIAAGAGALAAAVGLLWATSAANDGEETRTVAAAQPVAPAPRAVLATPVTTPVTPAVEPVLQTAEVQPVIRPTPAATPRAAPAPRARVAAASSAPSATDAGANVSTREYAPVTPEPTATSEAAAPAPIIVDEPPSAAPIPVIAE